MGVLFRRSDLQACTNIGCANVITFIPPPPSSSLLLHLLSSQALFRREVPPPFTPGTVGSLDTSNFETAFTKMPVQSVDNTSTSMGGSAREHVLTLPDFTFVAAGSPARMMEQHAGRDDDDDEHGGMGRRGSGASGEGEMGASDMSEEEIDVVDDSVDSLSLGGSFLVGEDRDGIGSHDPMSAFASQHHAHPVGNAANKAIESLLAGDGGGMGGASPQSMSSSMPFASSSYEDEATADMLADDQ